MNIKNIFMPVAKVLNNAGDFGKRNLPTILTCAGCVGFVATVYEASKATPGYVKVREDYERRKKENPAEEIKLSEKAIDVMDAYWKAAVLGVASMGCFVMANKINLERITALAAGYSMLDKKYKEYVDNSKKVFGSKENKVREAIATQNISGINIGNMSGKIINTGHGTTPVMDAHTHRLLYSDLNFIRSVVNDMNDDMLKTAKGAPFVDQRIYASLGDFYRRIGAPVDSEIFDNLGVDYYRDGLFTVDLEQTCLTEDGVPCSYMVPSANPIVDWEEAGYKSF